MDIEYESEKVKKHFDDLKLLERKIGRDATRYIAKRVNAFRATPNFQKYLDTGFGRPHPLSGNLRGDYAVDVAGGMRLLIRPILTTDQADLLSCVKIIILGVYDYHDRNKPKKIIP